MDLLTMAKLATRKTAGMSRRQALDFAAALLGITDRHIQIDSARAVVHASWTQLGTTHTLDISFADIVSLVNTEPAQPAVPWPSVAVTIGQRSASPP